MMMKTSKASVFKDKKISKRKFLSWLSLASGASLMGLGSLFVPSGVHSVLAQKTEQKNTWQEQMDAILAGQTPTESRVSLDLPDIVSHKSRIPFTITIDMPVTQQDYVTSINIFATRNKIPHIAHFQLSPLSGKAQVSGTFALDQPQEIVALAQTNENKFFIGRRQMQISLLREF